MAYSFKPRPGYKDDTRVFLKLGYKLLGLHENLHGQIRYIVKKQSALNIVDNSLFGCVYMSPLPSGLKSEAAEDTLGYALLNCEKLHVQVTDLDASEENLSTSLEYH